MTTTAQDHPGTANLEEPGEAMERALIGALVMDRDAIASVADRVTPAAFASARYRAMYSAILRLWEQRIPPDITTVHDALAGESLYAGDAWWTGASDLAGAMRDVVANGEPVHAPYYADRVVAHARRRAMSDAGTRIVQGIAARGALDPASVIYEAMAGMERFGAVESSSGLRAYDDLIPEYQDRIVRMRTGEIPDRRVSTGYPSLDRLLAGGMYPGELVILAARPSMGKALALDTPIPTPSGWTTMDELATGSQVFGRDGKPCTVTMKTPVQVNRECFAVRFSDGSEIIADADHRWMTSTRKDRKEGRTTECIVTTSEILATLRTRDGRSNHAVRNTGALDGPDMPLPIPPYTLGAWLGDGDSSTGRITKPDGAVFAGIAAEGLSVGSDISAANRTETRTVYGLVGSLRDTQVLADKHIPDRYLRASRAQRMSLLTGLMDTDGSIRPNGVAEFSGTSQSLARGVVDLILGMGWRCSIREARATLYGRDCGQKFIVRFTPLEQVFTIPRKAARFRPTPGPKSRTRHIESVSPVPSVPVACITVDSPDHMYLAGTSYIPTHNTALGLQIGHAVAKQRRHTLVFSAEMSADALLRRAASELSGIAADTALDERQYDLFLQALEHLRSLPVSIDDTSGITTAQMMVRVQAAQRTRDVGVVVFDYIELAGDEVRGDSEERRISKIVRSLKHMARVCDVPVLALCQLNRNLEHRSDKRPTLSDLRYSGSLEQEADKVLFLYRHDYYVSLDQADPESGREQIAEVKVAKHRNGPTGTIDLHFQPSNMMFHEVAYRGPEMQRQAFA